MTGPVRPDGYIDYFAESNDIRGHDILPADNAALDLLRALGPHIKDCDSFATRWKLLTENALSESPDRYAAPDSGVYLEPPEAIWDSLQEAEIRPWSNDEFPGVSRWIDANEQAMQLVHQAAEKSGFWLPVVADEGDSSSLAADCQGIANPRGLTNCLRARAMRRLGDRQIEDCQDDLIAIRQLASLMTNRAEYGQYTVALDVVVNVFIPESELIKSNLSREQLKRYAHLLRETAPYAPPVTNIGTHSRLAMLSAVQLLHLEGRGAFDIDVALTMVNELYDHLETIVGETDDGSSAAWLNDLFGRMDNGGWKTLIAYGGRKTRARGIGIMVMSLLSPATGHLRDTVAGACVRTTMIQTGIAIQLFRATNKRFPRQLSELVPLYLPGFPQDEFADGQPLTFTQTENGCSLMSVGHRLYPDTEDGIRLEIEN